MVFHGWEYFMEKTLENSNDFLHNRSKRIDFHKSFENTFPSLGEEQKENNRFKYRELMIRFC
jgi:Fic family protein